MPSVCIFVCLPEESARASTDLNARVLLCKGSHVIIDVYIIILSVFFSFIREKKNLFLAVSLVNVIIMGRGLGLPACVCVCVCFFPILYYAIIRHGSVSSVIASSVTNYFMFLLSRSIFPSILRLHILNLFPM
jgi:hypothetical protein